jgi:NAD(P)H-hydrate epimerase
MKPLSCEQIRGVDRFAMENLGIPGIVLMENAGRGAADCITAHWPGAPITVLCGVGNNGGDGMVIARHLDAAGHRVQIVLLGEPARLSPDARVNWEICQRSMLPSICAPRPDAQQLQELLREEHVILDAMLGTGATGTPRSPFREAVEVSNALTGSHRVAIDLPTGFDADSGNCHTPCFEAEWTLTFVAPKLGFHQPEARRFVGEVTVLPIGVPRMAIHRITGQ